MAAEIKITGLKELQAKLAELPSRVSKKIAREGLTKGARIVRDRAKELVPVDDGDLRKSIKVRGLMRAKQMGFLKATKGIDQGVPPVGKEVAATAPHAHLIEKGRKGAAAQPFLSAALEQTRDAVVAAIADSVSASLKEIGK